MATNPYNKGDLVVLRETHRLPSPGNYYNRVEVAGGTVGTVTSITSGIAASVRFTGIDGVRAVYVSELEPGDPEQARLASLKLAERVPDGMISPLDPKLDWFWDAAGKEANVLNFCAEYDRITAKLGVPGRAKDFNLKVVVGDGLTASITINARSKQLAEEIAVSKGATLATN